MQKIFTLFTAVILLYSVTACDVENKSNPALDAVQVGSGRQNISFVHFFPTDSTEGNAIVFIKVMNEFKKLNPEITFSEEALNHDTYEAKIRTLSAGNELPDLFVVKGSMLNMFIENGLINPVDQLLDRDPIWKNGFLTGAFDDFTIDDRIYGIPFQMLNTHLIYYNKKLFKDCGIDTFPVTWEEFMGAIVKIRDKGFLPVSLGNKANWVAESCILSTLGDRFTGTEWFTSIKEKTGASFTDPEFVNALRALQEMVHAGAFNADMNSIDNMQQKTAYYNGKAAMFIEGNWAISSVIADAPQKVRDNTELALFPAVTGGKGDTMANSTGPAWAYNVNSNMSGEKLDVAYKVLKTLTDVNYARVAIENNAFSASNPMNINKSALPPLVSKYLDLTADIKPVPIYDARLPADLIQVMNTGLQELLVNSISPEALAKKIQTAYEK